MTPLISHPRLQGSDAQTTPRSKGASPRATQASFLMLVQRMGLGGAKDPSAAVPGQKASEDHQADGSSAASPRTDAAPVVLTPQLASIEEVDLSRLDPAVLNQPDPRGEEQGNDLVAEGLMPAEPSAAAIFDSSNRAAGTSETAAGARATRRVLGGLLPGEMRLENSHRGVAVGIGQATQVAGEWAGAAAGTSEASGIGLATSQTMRFESINRGSALEPGQAFHAADEGAKGNLGAAQADARGAPLQQPLSQVGASAEGGLRSAMQPQPGTPTGAVSLDTSPDGRRPEPLFGSLFAASSGGLGDSRADVRLRRGSGDVTASSSTAASRTDIRQGGSSEAFKSLEFSGLEGISPSTEEVAPRAERSWSSGLQEPFFREAAVQETPLRNEGVRSLPEGPRPFALQVARQVGDAVVTSKMAPDGKVRELRISLRPEHLGHVDVRIETHDEVSRALVRTDTHQAGELLRAEIRTLEQALRDAGFKLDNGIEVQVREQEADGQERREQGFRQEQGGAGGNGDQRDQAPEEPVVQRLLDPDAEIAVVI